MAWHNDFHKMYDSDIFYKRIVISYKLIQELFPSCQRVWLLYKEQYYILRPVFIDKCIQFLLKFLMTVANLTTFG